MDNQHTSGGYHGSYKSYIIGFILSVILTVIPFAIVMHPTMSHTTIIVAIVVFAAVQMAVHLYYFLHLSTSPEQRWNMVAFIYTFLMIGVLVLGSIWIMYHLDQNMMMR
jgi:cytochrome o ubiquinol oxidase operon protein cyoD